MQGEGTCSGFKFNLFHQSGVTLKPNIDSFLLDLCWAKPVRNYLAPIGAVILQTRPVVVGGSQANERSPSLRSS